MDGLTAGFPTRRPVECFVDWGGETKKGEVTEWNPTLSKDYLERLSLYGDGTLLGSSVSRLGLEIGDVHGAFPFDDRAVRILLRLLQVALDEGDALDAGALFGAKEFENLPGFSFMSAGDYDDFFAAFDVVFSGHFREPPERAK
jgi:hypothetical protein